MKHTNYTQDLSHEGFSPDSIRALYLIPVIDTAWADGKVQPEEEREILQLLEKRMIFEGSEAYALVKSWLSKKPTDEFFVRANSLIEPLFQDLRDNRRGSLSWVFEAAQRVAQATGNSKNPISPGEKKVIKSLLSRFQMRRASGEARGVVT